MSTCAKLSQCADSQTLVLFFSSKGSLPASCKRPQEKSYFALRLPHGWWLFGLDLALVDDIDMCQCR